MKPCSSEGARISVLLLWAVLKGWYIYMEQGGHLFRMVDSHGEWDDRHPFFLHGGPGGRRLAYRFACEGSSVPSTSRYSALPVICRVRGFEVRMFFCGQF